MAISKDASSPAVATSTTASVTTASFTPAANTLLLAFVGLGNAAKSSTNLPFSAVTDSASRSWTNVGRGNASSGGCAEIWVADAGASPAACTVTATDQSATLNGKGMILEVWVLNGALAAASQPGGASASQATQTTSVTVGTTGSSVFCTYVDSGTTTVPSGAASGYTLSQTFSDTTNSNSFGTTFQHNVSSGASSAGVTSTPTAQSIVVGVEIKAAAVVVVNVPESASWQQGPRRAATVYR